MPSRVDFYLVAGDTRARDVAACRIADKAWREGHLVHVRTPGPDDAARLDDLLWTFSDGAFVPHARAGHLPAGVTAPPVLVSDTHIDDDKGNIVLINLSESAPESATGYVRVIEVVAADEIARAGARERFKSYRAQGAEMHTHHLSGDT
jgi:DNA polymerase-3 subunit chi